MPASCPFCALLSETAFPRPQIIHRSARTLSILDIAPLHPGHILLVPRSHHSTLVDLPTATAAELGAWISLLSRSIVRALELGDQDEAGWNVICNNGERAAQTVPHVHYHIIPRPRLAPVPTDKQKSWVAFGRGLRGDLDEDEAAVLADKLRSAVDFEIEGVRQKEGHHGIQLLGLEPISRPMDKGKL